MPSIPLDVSDTSVQHQDLTTTIMDTTVPVKSLEKGVITITSAEVGSEDNSETHTDDESNSASASGDSLEKSELPVNDELPVQATESPQPVSSVVKAVNVLQVIETYGVNFERDTTWDGLAGFVPTVTEQIEKGEPVRLLLPGFPFKAPNTKKVLGTLPDLGEKLALGHLNGLCRNIAEVYEHGAEVHICSDGLVYNDLLGVSDEDVWEYGEAVRLIAERDGLDHIKFIRLWDLLGHPGPWTKDFYLAHASCIRREMVYRFGDPQFEIKGEDQLKTHRGYIKFVSEDLVFENLSDEEKESKVHDIAKNMMSRWKAYASALEASRKNYVRLSIHDSVGKGKLSMSLFPQERGTVARTPWHCAMAVELDGSFRTVRPSEVQDTHELVYVDGRPSHFRAKSEIFDWKADGLDVTFEHVYPTGLFVRPVVSATNPAPSITSLPMKKVRRLAQTFSPIVLRGFSETTQEDLFLNKGYELGEVLTWTFGQILKVKDSGEKDSNANNVTSNEAMPMHFDGIFKFVDHVDPETGEVKKVLTPPRYQYFTCLSTAPKGTGFTLFANSRLFFRHLPSPWSLSRLENITWDMLNDGFWSAKQTGLPLVVRHKETGASCLRWHQPWTNTKFSKYYITIENEPQGPELVDVINKLVYDHRVCLRFEWEAGDLLINDNVSMLHTRTAFTGSCDREMWRIHFD